MLVISYYTSDYADEACRLIQSCERRGIHYDVRLIADQGGWQANTRYKSRFIQSMRAMRVGPLLWLDADAEVCASLDSLSRIDSDIAVHRRDGHELLSGTVWLNDTPAAKHLVNRWVDECDGHPNRWDQRSLEAAIGKSDARVCELPPQYCLIYDSMREHEPAVIRHYQASRRLAR